MKKIFTLVLGMVMAVCAYGQSTTGQRIFPVGNTVC